MGKLFKRIPIYAIQALLGSLRLNILLLPFLLSTVGEVFAEETADEGRKGDWTWDQHIASTSIGAGVRLVVAFSADGNCDMAILMVYGNANIRELSLTVDGTYYGITEMSPVPGTAITGVVLGSSVLKGIKHGNNAKVTTNVGSANLPLYGSAKALNAAYANCRERAQPIVADSPLPPAEQTPSASNDVFFAERTRGDGSSIVAVNNVVSIYDDIQEGDDLRLRELVTEMESAGVQFRSAMFWKNDGGALGTAMDIGKFIRSKRANTAVAGYPTDDGVPPHCASACVYAFAGGVERTIYLPARIGMHQASLADGSDGTMDDGQRVVANMYQYLSEMGIDPEMVIEGSKRSPDEMWWFTPYEAKGYGLATRITKPHELR